MPMRTLLAVDDDKLWLATLNKWFTKAGYNVHAAATCAEAIRMADTLLPDCVLLDYSLGDGTGAEVCAFIRNSEKLRKTPIIVVSGCEEEELASHNQYQADAFILKPAQLAKVQAVMESALRRIRMDRDIVIHGDLRLEGASRQVYRDSKFVAQLCAEQFMLFSVLLGKSSSFVSEEELSMNVYAGKEPPEKGEGVRGVAQRLRENLGPQLSRRIKSKADKGWIYLRPRART